MYLSPEFFMYTIRDGTKKQYILITMHHNEDMGAHRKEEEM